VRAITHLVAASVEGLKPENVVVLDVDGELLAAGSQDEGQAGLAGQSDTRRAAEAAQSAAVEAKVRQLLETVLGPSKSVVKASVVLDWTQRDITTQSVDPATTAVRSSQTLTETYNADGLAVGGVPGALSNLPPLTTTTSISGTEGALYWRQENTTNYEMTQVQSHEVVAPGQVDHISLSVMVDGVTDTQRLDSLKVAIAAAAGIQETRGDVLAVESLSFDRTYAEAQAAEMAGEAQTELYWQIGLAVAPCSGTSSGC
jgi:flagellar M-ring protein FliF